MPTPWFFPQTISQYYEIPQHIAWDTSGLGFYNCQYPDGFYMSTVLPLVHLSNTWVNDVKMKTYYLSLTNYNISGITIVNGIEALLIMDRGGRITDETIQLQYQSNGIGINQATADLSIEKSYGGEGNFWGLNTITTSTVMDSSFGITLRFQSHPSWPHRVAPRINSVGIRIW